MAGYKQDQGRMARTAVFWALAVLLYFGCTSLKTMLSSYASLARPLTEGMRRIPVLGIPFNAAFLIAAVVFLSGVWALYRWCERPRTADLLIETEAEMRKVTWPSINEVLNSSMVVVLCVLVLMVFLAGADWLFARVSQRLLFGEGGSS